MDQPTVVNQDMYYEHRELMYQGGKLGVPPQRVMLAAAVLLAVESGNVPCPDQEDVEYYLATETTELESVLAFMDAYPDFVPLARAYALETHPSIFYILSDEWEQTRRR